MSEKIKVIVKRPDEKRGHIVHISNDLEHLQRAVGGRIEVVPTGLRGALIICDEEGKRKPYQSNFQIGTVFPDVIRGTVVVCGSAGEEFADVPITLAQWGLMLEMWGNK